MTLFIINVVIIAMMKARFYSVLESFIALIVLVASVITPAYATERIAVLELTSEAAPESVLLTITDSVRSGTRDVLSGDEYIVMTRQNMITVLGDNGIDASCVEGQCELDLARAMQANLVVTGRLISVEGQFHLNLNIYNVGNGDLLKAEDVWAGSIRELIDASEQTARVLIREALGVYGSGRQEVGREGRIGGGEGLDLGSSSRVVIVRFESVPSGASVSVDNQILCNTPCSRDLSPGTHRVTMGAERYYTSEDRLVISSDETVSMTLEPAFGLLSVTTSPMGLPVKINGEDSGSDIEALELPSGTYDVVVETECHRLEGERITLNDGDERSINISPPVREAGLELSLADEEGNTIRGDVFVDGVEVGGAPGRVAVPVCYEEIRVVAEDGLSWSGELDLVENQVTSHEIVLTGDTGNKLPSVQEVTVSEYSPPVSRASWSSDLWWAIVDPIGEMVDDPLYTLWESLYFGGRYDSDDIARFSIWFVPKASWGLEEYWYLLNVGWSYGDGSSQWDLEYEQNFYDAPLTIFTGAYAKNSSYSSTIANIDTNEPDDSTRPSNYTTTSGEISPHWTRGAVLGLRFYFDVWMLDYNIFGDTSRISTYVSIEESGHLFFGGALDFSFAILDG